MLTVQEDNFEILEKVGRGTYGEVFKAKTKDTGAICVIKQVDLRDMPPQEKEYAQNEVEILSQLHHPHIIQYFGSFVDHSMQLNIVMEFADRQSLYHRIHAQVTPFEEDFIWKIFIQMALALLHIHQQNILHRDMKSANVFLSTNEVDGSDMVKLGDFGVAKHVLHKQSLMRTIIGTPYYLSPEICKNRPYGERSDVWALGIILYEMCALRHPFEASNQGSLILKIIRGRYAPISALYSQQLAQICSLCLAADTNRRPTVLQLLSHPILIHKADALSIELPAEALQSRTSQRGMPHVVSPRAVPNKLGHAVSASWASPQDPDGHTVVYIADEGPPTQGKATLPLFTRGAIESRKPGGHIQSRRVRTKKQAPPAATAPPSPAYCVPPLRQPPPPLRKVVRRHSSQCVRSPDPGGFMSQVQSHASNRGFGKEADNHARPDSRTKHPFKRNPFHYSADCCISGRSKWDKAARYEPINMHDTLDVASGDEQDDPESALNHSTSLHADDMVEQGDNTRVTTAAGSPEPPPQGLRGCWQRPERTLQLPEVQGTLQSSLRVPEEMEIDSPVAVSPAHGPPSDLDCSIPEEAALRSQSDTLDSDVDHGSSAAEVEEDLVEGRSRAASLDLALSATGNRAIEPTSSSPLPNVVDQQEDLLRQNSELRVEIERLRAEGELLVGSTAFVDIYHQISSDELPAEQLHDMVQQRLTAAGIAEETMVEVVQRIYQMLSMETAIQENDRQLNEVEETEVAAMYNSPF